MWYLSEIFCQDIANDWGIDFLDDFNFLFFILKFSDESLGQYFQKRLSFLSWGYRIDEDDTLFPFVEVIFFNKLIIILMGNVFENVSDKWVCGFGEECF